MFYLEKLSKLFFACLIWPSNLLESLAVLISLSQHLDSEEWTFSLADQLSEMQLSKHIHHQ
jgi:hypothetical protein